MIRGILLAAVVAMLMPLAMHTVQASDTSVRLAPGVTLHLGDRDRRGYYWDGHHWREPRWFNDRYAYKERRWWRHEAWRRHQQWERERRWHARDRQHRWEHEHRHWHAERREHHRYPERYR
ncbi:zinc ABC transporter substrate-binding protein [Pantoea ananatis]|uniref:DUF2502 domain-containing protein n=1 Tax=Pantoea ananas TaxID=553 RepID=UPI00031B1D31|nr:DUF2502 domain-containing protein [Pantoea ananatis]MDC7866232.1 zinc ABC transporter substrate-binding protein [Pantoea ananatis]MDQ1226810.1 hypothetical protein [Pantoea ananatis]MDR6088684.1 hypothetical protein [Pantoea ananatis]PKC31337.1 hypothetical protein V462_18475 [Pantoea ananatis 15320]PKC36609.1 hypothetical protein V462_09465 [Pantoea ananatis 15320]